MGIERPSGEPTWHSTIRIGICIRLLLEVLEFHPVGLVGKAEFLKDYQNFGWVGYMVYESVSGPAIDGEKGAPTPPKDRDGLHCRDVDNMKVGF